MKAVYILSVTFMALLCSCHNSNYYITFVNNSDIDVCVDDSYDWPDTTITLCYFKGIVKANSESNSVLTLRPSSSWHKKFNIYDTIIFNVFDAHVYKAWNPEESPKYILKRYFLTEADMIANDWTIVYP
ncbi:MAG: hypothetical protein MJ069_09670 [Salinivirgaceae bacterium]|nr:hypothetical protein [Salinivirgaceae bacterium]